MSRSFQSQGVKMKFSFRDMLCSSKNALTYGIKMLRSRLKLSTDNWDKNSTPCTSLPSFGSKGQSINAIKPESYKKYSYNLTTIQLSQSSQAICVCINT
jgi:hypothetical protein